VLTLQKVVPIARSAQPESVDLTVFKNTNTNEVLTLRKVDPVALS